MELLKFSPRLSPQDAAKLAERLYGIRASATSLPSERDQNFLLVDHAGAKFVLKIANALETGDFLKAQNQALAHLATRVTFCPRVIPTLTGSQMETTESATGETHYLRLLTHLPGVLLAEVKGDAPHLWQDLGLKLGQLSLALADFDHPAAHRDFHWDLALGAQVIQEYRPLITDSVVGKFVDQCATRFENRVGPLLAGLRRSVIHGDANNYNVLVSDAGLEPQRVVGLIDFGDLLYSYTVAELAVAMAYGVLDKPDSLATAALLVDGYRKHFPLHDDETAALWGLMLMRICMSVCHAAHQQQQQPDNDYLAISQSTIRNSLAVLRSIDWEQATERFMRESVHTQVKGAGKQGARETLGLRQQLLGSNLSIAYKDPIKILRGSMQYLYDDEGREYLDAYNNVAHVGHCHPRVVMAGQEQMAQLNTNTRYLHDLINSYAEHLTATLPAPLSVCFFVNSGSEANELALRLARAHTNARELIVLDHAYHGNTTTLIDISPYKHDGPGGRGAPAWVHKVPLPDLYRGDHRSHDPLAADKYARAVTVVIDELQERGIGVSGFIAESLPSVAGQIVFPNGYLAQVYAAVRKAGGVCIADEVQTGYGRIGSHFWGFETQGVIPDIVVLGKPIGNGHPIGAVVTTREIAASFANGMEFFSTFGGNTVSCAIGLTVLNVVLEERLQAHALRVGEQMLKGLRELMDRHEIIGDIRGSGFFLGVELVRSRETREPATSEADAVVNQLRHEGILLGTDGPFHNVLKIRPPMPFSASDADRLMSTLDKVLGER